MEKLHLFIISNKRVNKLLFNKDAEYNRFNRWRLTLIDIRNFKGR